ncbi:transglutaminase-like cysteine peptidase [Chelativorans sp. SCAU2101]|uniref:Transglutaminase-like cysteine peptidase n=1 Tax=Chelativorans petroleitrophicus TaxID=2975484 RepID=A0A9X3B5S6_9HYPH|nr:transglutaminase-like cysteine peptidase [Chelativorans petroleitrophicus]MCT8989197.1 transglutaminase-like cysteine peptidase [Chelativorans petroleitrophicus]
MAARRAGIVTAIVLCLAPGLTSSPAESSGLMVTGSVTSQPIGHYEFCQKRPQECAIRPRDTGPLKVTPALWNKIVAVNAAVNRAVKPDSDINIYGREEVWTYPVNGIGDCEDYVLEKRRRLHDAGISLSNLLITVVRKRDGEGHAVLTVRTDRGDYILDNLNSEVKLWSHTGYTYLKRQASNHTGRWVSLRDENNLLVGAVLEQ